MPSTAKQAETTAYESVRANPLTRVHGRPTRTDYDTLKTDACALASETGSRTSHTRGASPRQTTTDYLTTSLASTSTTTSPALTLT